MVGLREHVKSWVVPKFDIKDPSLVLYLPLWFPYSDMTGSTIYSYDTNRHTGDVTGATWGYQGRTFDGTDDEITVPDSASLDSATGAGQARTAILWFKTTTTANRVVMEKGTNLHFVVQTGFPTAGKIHWRVESISDNALESLNTVNDNIWYHFAGVYDGTVAELFIDGVSQGTNSSQVAPADDANGISIGSRAGVGAFPGEIGEVLIYNRALRAGEIQRIYQVTKWRYV